jgi:hypothetical protein
MIKRDATHHDLDPAVALDGAEARLAALVEVAEAQQYHGWANYPTWCVHAWLSNDQATWEGVLAIARQCLAGARVDPRGPDEHAAHPRWLVGDRLEACVRGTIDLAVMSSSASVFTDLCGWALGMVEWAEIADGVLETLSEQHG